MSPSAASERSAALCTFVSRHLSGRPFALAPASADASFRSYWRVTAGDRAWVVMDAPPEHEDCRPWLDVGRRLREVGLHAPEVLGADLDAGFLLLEDLGERTYLPELREDTVDALYGDALAALLKMQTRVDVAGLPSYDAARLHAEMALMPTWFLGRHLGVAEGSAGWEHIEPAFRQLITSALEQPTTFVHRDFHSRNLLITRENGPGIIDFQDAVQGPVTYDLVSLLRDCYIVWPEARVEAWAEGHRQRLLQAGVAVPDTARFRRWFDLMGLQRHIKVLGIFCRLWYRDGKAGYLADLPRVWGYVDAVASRYPAFDGLRAAMGAWIGARRLQEPTP
jgi:aminoglycoside/choline kinase family phosphotransferase